MPLPYTAPLYHVYDNHFMPQLSILLNASGGYFMLSYAASSLCEECFTLYFMPALCLYLVRYNFSITYSSLSRPSLVYRQLIAGFSGLAYLAEFSLSFVYQPTYPR